MNSELINNYNTIKELRDYVENTELKLYERSTKYESILKSLTVKKLDNTIISMIKKIFNKKAKNGIFIELKFSVYDKEEPRKRHQEKISFIVSEKQDLNKKLEDLHQVFFFCNCEAFNYSGASYYLWLKSMMSEDSSKLLLKPPEKKFNNKLLCKHLTAILYNPVFSKKVSDVVDKSYQKILLS